ncbi:MAG TPA: PHB depolymerase family esterase [Steroidobacter sp.]|uniref:PHB depolymerase family esterase n=1 Tax=Steroidobacter sp. TaxID=1978227 RepID=UPI002EDA2DA7
MSKLNIYDLGSTTSFACQYDQRFSYCLYVPPQFSEEARTNFRLLVAVHGTERKFQRLRDDFAALAREHDLIVLAPYFPCGIIEPRDRDNYKYLDYRGIRFDRVLISMIDEVVVRYSLSRHRMLMFGFSGGAHFCHRFAYLYPQLLAAISVGAPGSVTLLDAQADWWVGVRDVQQKFGRTMDYAQLEQIAAHVTVGEEDEETWEITHHPGSAHWMEGANSAGRTRKERAATLVRSLREHGVDVQFEELPGVAHKTAPHVEAAIRFFGDWLSAHSAR